MLPGVAGPKSIELAVLLSDYADEIEYDLLLLGLDILDWYRGTLSARRVLLILERLPMSSALWSKVQSEQTNTDPRILRSWGLAERLAARQIEATQWNTFATLQVNSKKKLKPPTSMKIPGENIAQPSSLVTVGELKSFMGA